MYRFPQKERDYFTYALIRGYGDYYQAMIWCRQHVSQYWTVEGDADAQVYRFAFMDARDHLMFVLEHSEHIYAS